MIETVLWDSGTSSEPNSDHRFPDHACRIALELGADVLKIP